MKQTKIYTLHVDLLRVNFWLNILFFCLSCVFPWVFDYDIIILTFLLFYWHTTTHTYSTHWDVDLTSTLFSVRIDRQSINWRRNTSQANTKTTWTVSNRFKLVIFHWNSNILKVFYLNIECLFLRNLNSNQYRNSDCLPKSIFLHFLAKVRVDMNILEII